MWIYFAGTLNFLISHLLSSGILRMWGRNGDRRAVLLGKQFARNTKRAVSSYEGAGDEEEMTASIAPLLTNIVLVGWSASVCAILGEFAAMRLRTLVSRPSRKSFNFCNNQVKVSTKAAAVAGWFLR